MNISEYIVKYIEDVVKIDRAYVIVGGAQLWMCKALSKAEKLSFTFTNHEQPAVQSAIGYGQISGKPGVAFITNGPAFTNAITGLAQAYADSNAVVVFTGNSNSHHVKYERETSMRQYGTQDVNTEALAKPVTKKYFFLDNPADTASVVEEAFRISESGRPGPVVVEIPIDIQGAPCPCAFPPEPVKEEPKCVSDEIILSVVRRLAEAKRPLIMAGQGVRLSHSTDLLHELIRNLDIPVVNPRMGIDSMETEDRYFVGRCGNHGSRASHFAIQTCDVLLILGSRLAPNATGYNVPAFSPQSFKILVEVDPHELNHYQLKIDEVLESDLHAFLSAALRLIDREHISGTHGKWVSCCENWKKRYPIMQQKFYENLNSYLVVNEVSRQAQEGDIVLADTGSSCSVVAQTWDVRKNQRVLISGGLSGMGYWATAMGVAQANAGHSNVIAFTGDGSLQMNIHELATIFTNQIPVKLFVISNDGYQFVRMSQSSYNINPTFGTDATDGVPIPDTQAITKAYGLNYLYCDTKKNLSAVVHEALAMNGPVVTEVAVTKDLNVEPRIRSIANPDGSFRMPTYENLYPYLDEKVLREELNKAFE